MTLKSNSKLNHLDKANSSSSNPSIKSSENRLAILSWREKLAYGFGDAGFNFYWALIGGYLAAFYTDTLGLTAATAGTLILITKVFDAFTCLLYTSPSPRDQRGSRMPSSA